MDTKNLILTICLGVIAILIFFSLLLAIKGPRRADRIMAINIIGSFSTAAIAVLGVILKESWLLDICLVYCLISFLAVVILTKISIINKGKEEKND